MQPTEAARPISLSSGSAQAAAQDRDRQSRARRRLVQRAHEDIAGFTDQGIEHRRRLPLDDFLDDVIDRGLAELEQALGENAAAGAGDDFPDYPVGFPGPDVVGADAEHVARNVIEHVPHQRHDRVVRRGADIDDVVAALKSLVARRMPEQSLGAFDDRDYLLARGRGVAADDVMRPAPRGSDRRRPCDRRQRRRRDRADAARTEIELVALVDLVDRHQRALFHLAAPSWRKVPCGKTRAREGWTAWSSAKPEQLRGDDQ